MAATAPILRRLCALGLTLVAVGGLAACGSDDDGGGSTSTGAATGGGAASETSAAPATTTPESGGASAGGTRLTIDAVEAGGLSWSRRALEAGPGEVTIALANPTANQLPHAVEIEGEGVEQESAIIEPGNDTTVSAQLRPGRYAFYCPVGDHRQQGMEGVLTVR